MCIYLSVLCWWLRVGWFCCRQAQQTNVVYIYLCLGYGCAQEREFMCMSLCPWLRRVDAEGIFLIFVGMGRVLKSCNRAPRAAGSVDHGGLATRRALLDAVSLLALWPFSVCF